MDKADNKRRREDLTEISGELHGMNEHTGAIDQVGIAKTKKHSGLLERSPEKE
ncbi:hypothetical protein [Lihuaxuella thermophila]|uniref:Uncharacterized protein n=1 Tax=Lihuaxuella thermophila TaxID=1173111 RepID=A0A1H8H6B6_9BACL|nr:hypothetical protein [Lihuaxuella thermophila]SEN51773.1 hypothetical protein SAMN05444955_11361 [Lihuaxuella thermophila]